MRGVRPRGEAKAVGAADRAPQGLFGLDLLEARCAPKEDPAAIEAWLGPGPGDRESVAQTLEHVSKFAMHSEVEGAPIGLVVLP